MVEQPIPQTVEGEGQTNPFCVNRKGELFITVKISPALATKYGFAPGARVSFRLIERARGGLGILLRPQPTIDTHACDTPARTTITQLTEQTIEK